MKIVIDENLPDLTDEEIAEIEERVIPDVSDNPEEFRRQMEGVTTIVLSEQVRKQLEEVGMSPDEVVAMILKAGGKTN